MLGGHRWPWCTTTVDFGQRFVPESPRTNGSDYVNLSGLSRVLLSPGHQMIMREPSFTGRIATRHAWLISLRRTQPEDSQHQAATRVSDETNSISGASSDNAAYRSVRLAALYEWPVTRPQLPCSCLLVIRRLGQLAACSHPQQCDFMFRHLNSLSVDSQFGTWLLRGRG